MKYLKTYKELCEDNIDTSANGPAIIYGKGDPSIGSYGGTNGGLIGAEFKGGSSEVSAKGEPEQYKYNITNLKKRQSLRQKKAIDKLIKLDIETEK